MDPVPVPVAAGVLDAAQDRRQWLSSLDSRPSPISRQIISNDWVILHTGQVLYYDWCLGAAGEMRDAELLPIWQWQYSWMRGRYTPIFTTPVIPQSKHSRAVIRSSFNVTTVNEYQK